MYELRYATRFDIDRIKLLLDSIKDIFGFLPRTAVWHSIAKGELIVATPIADSQTVIAFCRFHKRKDGITTIYEIYVDTEYRREEIGKRMVACLKGVIRAKCPMEYESNGFYKQLGFELIATEVGKRKQLNVWRLRYDRP